MRKILLFIVIALAIALGVAGLVLANNSAAQPLEERAAVVLPVYQPSTTNAAAAANEVDSAGAELSAADSAASSNAAGDAPVPLISDTGADAMASPADAAVAELESATVTPAEEAAIIVGEPSIVRAGGGSLLAAPDADPLADLPTGVPLTATARTEDGAWIYVKTERDEEGWIDARQILLLNPNALTVAPRPATAPNVAVEDTATGANIVESEVDAIAATAPLEPTLATITVANSRLNVRSGPGPGYDIVGKAYPNDVYAVQGRDAAGEWLLLEFPVADDSPTWVAAAFAALDSAIDDLPIVTSPAGPSEASLTASE